MWNDNLGKLCVPYLPFDPISIIRFAGPAKGNTFDVCRTRGGNIRRKLRYGASENNRQALPLEVNVSE